IVILLLLSVRTPNMTRWNFKATKLRILKRAAEFPLHYTHPPPASAAEFLYLIKYLEESRHFDVTRRQEEEEVRRLEEDNRRRYEEEVRCCAEEARRIEDEARRRENNERFMTLIQLLLAPMITVPAEPHVTASPAVSQTSTATYTASTISTATPTAFTMITVTSTASTISTATLRASTISTSASTVPVTTRMPPTVPISQKPLVQSPPTLQADATYQVF
ncbi:hypothetical protein SK128_001793, partial [Halocaridina rubra]